jgi:GNAT superfamily N-acetyltransferase
MAANMNIEVWDSGSPRWEEFLACLKEIAPEQAPFVLGDYSRHLPCTLLVALDNQRVIGFLRFGIQEIGAEERQPSLGLTEAKIHAFAVRPECRRRGVGTALQIAAIDQARSLGCHQLASHSSYASAENLRIKLALGFCVAVEEQGNGIRLFMPLKNAPHA